MADDTADRLKTMSVRELCNEYANNALISNGRPAHLCFHLNNEQGAIVAELERRCAPPAAPAGVPKAVELLRECRQEIHLAHSKDGAVYDPTLLIRLDAFLQLAGQT